MKKTIKELIINVASLVESREIINHGTIRMLHSLNAVREIESAEGCDSVGTGIIGDDDLAQGLREIVEDDQCGEIEWDALRKLENAYYGADITDYLDRDREDELMRLEKLIDAASEI